MTIFGRNWAGGALLVGLAVAGATAADANALREKGKTAKVGGSPLTLTPTRDWNRLDIKPGKNVETWTLDGEQLNDVTAYGGIEAGRPLVKERNKKREPLPMFRAETLLVEVPELLGNTYRAYKKIAAFTVTGTKPTPFLGKDGVVFTYDYIDSDNLPRKGEARAAVVSKKLFMVTYDAPRLHYFDRNLADFRALIDTAKVN